MANFFRKISIVFLSTAMLVLIFAGCGSSGDPSSPSGSSDSGSVPDNFTTAPVLTLTAGSGSLGYAWTASVPAADSYDLFYLEGSGLSAAKIRTGSKITGAISGGIVSTLKSGTAYSVLVAANKTGYKSIYSTVQTGTTTTNLLDMLWIPAGSFVMGSPTNELGRVFTSNETQHTVTLTSGFYMGKYAVTQAQYQAVMGTNPSWFTTPVSPETSTAQRPVECVNWYTALVFCNKLSMQEGFSPAYRISGSTDPTAWGSVPTNGNATWDAVIIDADSTGYRLPTEAQWEYACRAGTTTAFNWGSDYIDDRKANYDASYVNANNLVAGTTLARTTSVGSYAPNAWGLYDMHGNVQEWCWDWYGNYLAGTQLDPMGAVSGTNRVFRGGSWYYSGQSLRSACRLNEVPAAAYFIVASDNPYKVGVGFRVVRP